LGAIVSLRNKPQRLLLRELMCRFLATCLPVILLPVARGLVSSVGLARDERDRLLDPSEANNLRDSWD
jgi:hypothetical protein